LVVDGAIQTSIIYDTNTSYYIDPNSTSVINKLNANTIDPPYTINGDKYSTYVASMTGIKEETTGQVKTNQMIEGVGYRSVIDFTNLEKGSNLWLFTKTTDLKNNIDQLVVLLSPVGNTKTWYKVDKENLILKIFSSQPTTISYRQTAPRFDYQQWPNERKGKGDGLIIDDQPLEFNNQGNIEVDVPEEPTIYTYEDNTGNLAYAVKNAAGDLIQDTIGTSKAVVGKITAGVVDTSQVIANNIKSSRIETNEFISPVVKTEEIKSDNLVIDLTSGDSEPINSSMNGKTATTETQNTEETQSKMGTLLVKGNAGFEGNVGIGATTTTNDLIVNNNASVSGDISANRLEIRENLRAKEATFSAVYADNIVSKEGNFGDLVSDKINSVRAELEKLILNKEATPSANYDSGIGKEDTQAIDDTATGTSLAGQVEMWAELIKVDSPTSPDVTSGQVSLDNQMVIAANLVVNGKATAEEAFINKHLMVGNIAITENTISTLADTLYIQPSGTGKIDFLAGTMTIEENGGVSIDGDLDVNGAVIADQYRGKDGNFAVNLAQGKTSAEENLQGSESPTLKVEESAENNNTSGFGKMLVKGVDGETVMSVDASGSAKLAGNLEASGSGTFQKVNIATSSAEPIIADSMMADLATESAQLKTNATAGEAVIPSGKKEVIIYSGQLTDQSLVYITPTTDTSNQVLFVKSKQVAKEKTTPTPTQIEEDQEATSSAETEEKGSQFTVAVKETTESDIKFNWWIIN